MLLWHHFVVCTLLTIVLWPFFGPASLLVFVSGFLIDVDHILYYMFRFKEMSIKKIYKYYRTIGNTVDLNEYKKVIRPFHNIELFVVLVILSFVHPWFLIITISFVVHILMDLINEYVIFKEIHGYSIILFMKKRKT